MILVIDNYDSFTFNLVQLVGGFTDAVVVRRNDQITIAEIDAMKPAGIIVSPGPGRPEDAGVTVDVIRCCAPKVPILGVCLGHQAIGLAYGGAIVHAPSLMHGKTSLIHHDNSPLFKSVRNPFCATRYHSLVIDPDRIPGELSVTARTEDNVIMGVRHRIHPLEGVQFHPESILTEEGELIVRNWLEVHQCL